MPRLDNRQERFCEEYLKDPKRNQTNAAIRAGYSEKSARTTAYLHMKNAEILRRIDELRYEALAEAGYSPESFKAFVIQEHLDIIKAKPSSIIHLIKKDDARRKAAQEQIADSNEGQYQIDFGEDLVYIDPSSEWPPEMHSAVKSIKRGKHGVEIELYDKQSSLQQITAIAGITKNDMNVSLSISDALTEARQRMEGGDETD